MRLIDKAVKEDKCDFIPQEIKEQWIRRHRCPKDRGYSEIVQCKEGKYDCHNKTCWNIEIKE